MGRRHRFIARRNTAYEDYYPKISSILTAICLECPFPECISANGNGCDYYRKKEKEIKNGNFRKKVD